VVKINQPIIGDLIDLGDAFIGQPIEDYGLVLSVNVYEQAVAFSWQPEEPPQVRSWLCSIYSLRSRKVSDYRITPGILDSVLVTRCFDGNA
jgi:hypothetical protein